jgi:hypothetical protein
MSESKTQGSSADVFPCFTNPLDLVVRAKKTELVCYSLELNRNNSYPYRLARHFGSISASVRARRQQELELRTLSEHVQHDLKRLWELQQRYEAIIQALKLEKEPSELSRQYRKLVEQYSALQLTKATDRLPALSGLCKQVKHLRGDYLAGVWVDSIWLDLLWRVDTLRPEVGHARASQYRRPSWSWVSVESPVRYWDDIKSLSLGPPSYHPDEPLNEVALHVRELRRRALDFKYDIQLAGKNPFGEVSSAVLRVKSYSRAALLRYTYDSQAQGATNAHDPFRYKIEVEGADIPLFADYAFGIERPHKIRNCSMVTLLLVHPQIALVLTPSKRNSELSRKALEEEL